MNIQPGLTTEARKAKEGSHSAEGGTLERALFGEGEQHRRRSREEGKITQRMSVKDTRNHIIIITDLL